MTFVVLLVLLSVDFVIGSRSLLLSIRGGGSPVDKNGPPEYPNKRDLDQGAVIGTSSLHRSDDFYNPSAVRDRSAGLQLAEDDIFYEAVDYESASAINLVPKKYSKLISTDISTTSSRLAINKASFLKIFSVFAWKGFGLSFEKSVLQLNSFGAGLRIPVSSNFPEWDRNAAIPKCSTTLGLLYPYGCKFSVSVSYPLGQAAYGKSNL